jgi:hypothetical protein
MSSFADSESAIWERVIHPERGNLPVEAARFFLNLAFDDDDLQRLHELAVKQQAGALSEDDAAALANFRQVGLQIDLLRSKARHAMQQNAAP